MWNHRRHFFSLSLSLYPASVEKKTTRLLFGLFIIINTITFRYARKLVWQNIAPKRISSEFVFFFLFLCSSNKNGESSLIHVEHEHILHLKNTLLAFATYNRIIGIGLLLKLFASFLVSLPLSFNSFCYISLFCYAVLLFWPSKFVNIDFCKRKIEKKRKVKTSMFKHNQWYKQKKTNFQKKTIAIFASSICLFLAPLLFYFICCLAEITEMCE